MSVQPRHYIDTNAIIEASRIGAWNALFHNYSMCTVEKVVEECGSGSGMTPGYISVDTDKLKNDCQIEQVSQAQHAKLGLALQNQVILDEGEYHLLARAFDDKQDWEIISPDKAMIRACGVLNLLHRVVNLELLLRGCGFQGVGNLEVHHTEAWLSRIRTEIQFDLL